MAVSGSQRRFVAFTRHERTHRTTTTGLKVTRYNPFPFSVSSRIRAYVFFSSAAQFTYFVFCCFLGVLHEHPRIGSDGESEEVSLASDPDVTSPVKMRQKNRRLSEVINLNKSKLS